VLVLVGGGGWRWRLSELVMACGEGAKVDTERRRHSDGVGCEMGAEDKAE
jgi:hypothetical protein